MALRNNILWATIAALTMASSPAASEPGDGLSAGKLNLSPGLSLSTTFDSNVFFTSEDEETLSSPSLTVMPFLNISTVGADAVNFDLGASVQWQQYLRTNIDEISDQSGLSANVDVGVGFNEKGAVSFRLEDSFARTNEPPTDISSASFDRTINRAGATLGVHPGGKVFQHYLSYDFTLQLHDEFPDIDRKVHDITLHNHWKFLPRTALLLNGDLGLIRYDEPTRTRGDRDFANINSTPLRITGGLRGLITNRLSVQLLAGWGIGFYSNGNDFGGLLVDSRVTYFFGPIAERSSVYLGYEKSFNDTTIASFVSTHRPYIGYLQGIADRRLRLNARLDFFFREYDGVPAGLYNVAAGQVNVPADLNDTLLRIRLGADFDIRKWFTLGINYSLSANFTDDRITASGAADDSVREFVRHFVGLSATLRY